MKYECDICKDDGLCLNNEKNPNYDGGFFGSDIYDCCDYLNVKEGKPKGSWMIDWMKRLKKEKPYESDFVKWSKRFKVIIPFLLVISCNH
jgi:hypothetical protein|tara:strand:- start:211 stop:480 length:270 start_codon:yes stop_codon:yes gene_type:complete